jgi:predicted phage terminase large subunit-like protein
LLEVPEERRQERKTTAWVAMSTPQQQAAAELLRRRRARANPIAFAEFVDVPGRPVEDEPEDGELPMLEAPETMLAPHHKMILEEVERCFLKDTGRLMIFMPPGSAKSTYASVVSPAYLMGKYAKTRCGLFSYADSLALKMGRRTRSIINQKRYQRTFDTALSNESAAANNFVLENRSEYMATGILGAATGNRFEILFIDDPVKGREQADSDTIREKTWDAYNDDLKTRLVPGGSVVIIMTRWHEDDLAGRILPDGWDGESGDIPCKDGNVWRVLCIQAQCENDSDPLGRERGEMLWPEWFTEKHWAQFRPNARTWGSLCQQLPKPKAGNLFKPDKIEIIEALPAGRIKWVRGWDLAATENGGAYTVGAMLGIHQESQRPVIAGIERAQKGPGNRDEWIKGIVVGDGRLIKQDFPQDPGAAGNAVIEYIVKKLKGYPVVWGPESGDKEQRAEPFAAEVNVGNVMMVRGDWNKVLTDEMRAFPNGTYKDQVDALSRAYTRLVPLPGKMTVSKTLLDKVRARR